jgi:hypothetical protein
MKIRSRSLITRALLEAFDITKRALGEIKFRQSKLTDPHIKQIILQVSQNTSVPPDKILENIRAQVKEVVKMKKYSPFLFDTAARMVIDQAAFNLIEHARTPDMPKFDLATFMELIDRIQLEHKDQFMPLRAPNEIQYIRAVNPILIPNSDAKLQARFGSVSTAAATAKGEFIFNVPFMQKLMDYATMEGTQPQGKKYECNGGDIPDNYCMIEFLIIHELLHYTYGDFTTGAKLNQYSHTEHNYASDFRSNYMLVKNGYTQLPLGLFSDHINYDRQGSYKDMVELVHQELKKMPKPLQDEFNKLAKTDEHPPEGSGDPGESPPSNKSIKVGAVVKDKASGGYWRVTSIENGKVDTVAATSDEIAAAIGAKKESKLSPRSMI